MIFYNNIEAAAPEQMDLQPANANLQNNIVCISYKLVKQPGPYPDPFLGCSGFLPQLSYQEMEPIKSPKSI